MCYEKSLYFEIFIRLCLFLLVEFVGVNFERVRLRGRILRFDWVKVIDMGVLV